MRVIGVDLSGPGNPDNTAVAVFDLSDGRLAYETLITSVSDEVLYAEVKKGLEAGDVCVGLDAPLSYGAGGGQREADADLRARVVAAGLPPGSVMAPTAPRMTYLTLRGLAVSRGLHLLGGPGELRIVETHPGAALALGGAPIVPIREFRDSVESRRVLLQWLTGQGVEKIGTNVIFTDHSVAACAAAWAAWLWMKGESNWMWPANPPHHPFDFAC